MLRTGIIWKKCWLVLVLFEFGNYAFIKDGNEYTIEKKDCTERTIRDTKCMDCSSVVPGNVQIEVKSVPVGLETTLRCLYMKNLLFVGKYDKTMFKDYPDLTDLHMIRDGFSFDTGTDIFEMLTNLQYLNLSYTNIIQDTEYKVPKSVRILDYTNVSLSALNLEHLHLLQILDVTFTPLQNFPKLHDLAPIKLVVLDHVNMINFKLDEFAKYCHIEEISTHEMSLGNDNCKCLQLMEWTKKYNIKVTHPPNCKPDNKCSLEFSQASIKNRDACLAKDSHTTLYLIIAGAVLLLLLVLGLATYLHQKLIKQEEVEGIKYVDGHVEVQKPVKEETGEEEATPDDEIANEEKTSTD